jgi:thioredoxin 1
MRILYFTTPECVECRLRQEPALRELEERFGPRLVVEKRDAIEETELARRYRVRTVPTTAVFGPDGRLVEINYGFASSERLAGQLATALPS